MAGIGELLLDVFPTHRRLGGAPANFAFHCGQLGATAAPVSCLGADPLGREIRDLLEEMGVDTSYLAESEVYPTGTVEVALHEGKPTYDIREDVAWDHIPWTGTLRALAARLDAVCFGALAQRSVESRETIRAFLEVVPDHALKIFDVNLRQAFSSRQVIRESLALANVLKLSDEELPVLAGYFDLIGDPREKLMQLRERFDLRWVAYTRGIDGSMLLGESEMADSPGQGEKAVDSVGAGDSFTASLCMGLLSGWPPGAVNALANEVASFVCSQQGATPELPAELTMREVCQ